MRIKEPHPWGAPPLKAREIQERLRPFILLKDLFGNVTKVAGTDVSYSRVSERLWAGAVVLHYPSLEIAEEGWVEGQADYPYIPGLLSFRELPHILKALEKLKSDPDLIFCDGQGIAHPRGFGLASHLGILLGKPTIGCAKNRLVGESPQVGTSKGDYEYLLYEGRQVGTVLTTREGVKPLFLSPGHGITVESATSWTLRCSGRYRLPEPIRQAHALVNRLRWRKEGF